MVLLWQRKNYCIETITSEDHPRWGKTYRNQKRGKSSFDTLDGLNINIKEDMKEILGSNINVDQIKEELKIIELLIEKLESDEPMECYTKNGCPFIALWIFLLNN